MYITIGAGLLIFSSLWSLTIDWKGTRCCDNTQYNHKLSRLARMSLLLLGTAILTAGLVVYPIKPHNIDTRYRTPHIECKYDGCWVKYKLKYIEQIP